MQTFVANDAEILTGRVGDFTESGNGSRDLADTGINVGKNRCTLRVIKAVDGVARQQRIALANLFNIVAELPWCATEVGQRIKMAYGLQDAVAGKCIVEVGKC